MEIISKQELRATLDQHKNGWGFMAPILMRTLKLTELNNLYRATYGLEGIALIDAVLQSLGITYQVSAQDLQKIPAKGGFMIIANHPYGGLDGLLMLLILLEARPDFKVMANELLLKLPGLQHSLIPVDPFKPENRKNVPGLRKVLEHLHNDMPVGIFPAGEVSSFSFTSKKITDPEWKPATRRLLDLAKVPVIPMHFSGTNSISFQLAGLLHASFRTVRLPAELFNKKGLNIQIRIGKSISCAELQQFPDADKMAYLRARTYAMQPDKAPLDSLERLYKRAELPRKLMAEIHHTEIEKEIAALPVSAKIITERPFGIYLASQPQIPVTLREIGRLRELTFREIGEGTNQEKDLDWYDQHYKHLFVYDHSARLLVGAYRLGEGSMIFEKFGKKGFYLHTLFKMRAPFVEILKQSMELGRSFIRPEYQKKPLPLLLLWKGISICLEQNPACKYLIGPVSISNYFSQFSKALMVDFILKYYYDLELAQYIKPRKKFRYRLSEQLANQLLNRHVNSISSLSDLVHKIESKQAGIPVLLKKYLKQNARIIGFNIDPKFSNALDGFMIMDVKNLPSDTVQLLKKNHKTVSD